MTRLKSIDLDQCAKSNNLKVSRRVLELFKVDVTFRDGQRKREREGARFPLRLHSCK